jgi:hypothetical protein
MVNSRRMRWARLLVMRNTHKDLVGKPEDKRPLGRPKRRWEKILKWII